MTDKEKLEIATEFLLLVRDWKLTTDELRQIAKDIITKIEAS